jgi:M6 family metalloprotease-like protein
MTGTALADEPMPHLTGYRTTSTAKTTTVRQLRGLPKQPAHLGVFAENDAGAVRIAAIEPESPAAAAGLKVGDRVLALDGKPTTTLDAFRTTLTALTDGDRATLTVQRDGKPLAVNVLLGSVSRPMSTLPRAVLGVQMTPAASGVKIDSVMWGQAAERAGIQPGDIVTKIGKSEVTNLDKLREILNGHLPGDIVTVVVRRDGKEMSLDCQLAAERSGMGTLGDWSERGGLGSDLPTLANWDMRRTGAWMKPTYRLAVILVAFPDQTFDEKIPKAQWERALLSIGQFKDRNATGQTVYGSLADYYREISCGKLTVTGKIFDPIVLSKKRSEYSQSAMRFAMLTEALDGLSSRDGKNALDEFDGLFFLYAGPRVQTNRGGIFWPHRASLSYAGQRWAYFICPEGGDRMASISIMSHEFGHMLGLPDLYARPDAPGSEGVGVWCTMSTGHGSDGRPLHFSAWCKEQLGWLKPCVIDPTVQQKLILAPVHGSSTECYKVLLRPDGSEYLLLENRVRRGFDRDLPGEGLLIWRVVDGRPVLEESHGITTAEGPMRYLGSVPYPSKSNTAFTPYTTPSSKPVKVGGLPVHITNIRKLPDGRITFHIGYEYL